MNNSTGVNGKEKQKAKSKKAIFYNRAQNPTFLEVDSNFQEMTRRFDHLSDECNYNIQLRIKSEKNQDLIHNGK